MIQQTEIHTPRLLLKSITPAIIHEVFEHKTKDEVMAFFAADTDAYAHLESMHEGGMETHRLSMFYFLLVDKGTGRIIGECGFHTWNKTHNRADFFYSLRYDADKRKGYMTEAAATVLDFGFNQLGLHRVAALVGSENTASLRLLAHFGFVKEGTMREDYVVNGTNEDSECYSLLKWEWGNKS